MVALSPGKTVATHDERNLKRGNFGWVQVFSKDAFAKLGKYFRALRFTCEGEGKHKLVGAASSLIAACWHITSALQMSLAVKLLTAPGQCTRMSAVSGLDDCAMRKCTMQQRQSAADTVMFVLMPVAALQQGRCPCC